MSIYIRTWNSFKNDLAIFTFCARGCILWISLKIKRKWKFYATWLNKLRAYDLSYADAVALKKHMFSFCEVSINLELFYLNYKQNRKLLWSVSHMFCIPYLQVMRQPARAHLVQVMDLVRHSPNRVTMDKDNSHIHRTNRAVYQSLHKAIFHQMRVHHFLDHPISGSQHLVWIRTGHPLDTIHMDRCHPHSHHIHSRQHLDLIRHTSHCNHCRHINPFSRISHSLHHLPHHRNSVPIWITFNNSTIRMCGRSISL